MAMRALASRAVDWHHPHRGVDVDKLRWMEIDPADGAAVLFGLGRAPDAAGRTLVCASECFGFD